MSLGFGHLVGAWLPAKIVEYYKKTEFSRWFWGFFLFGALLPDGDFFLEWLNIVDNVHRGFSHSILAIVISFFIGTAVAMILKNQGFKVKPKMLGFALALGVLSHIAYDVLFYPGTNLLWPFDWWFAQGSFYFAETTLYERVGGRISELNKTDLFIFDTGLGAAWFFYFLIKGRLKP